MTHSIMRRYGLAIVLTARGLVNGAFTWWLLSRRPGWTDVFHTGSSYGFIDGTLGLIAVAFLLEMPPDGAPPLLRTTTLLDALVRLAVSIAIRTLPGIPDTPITVMLFFSLLGAYAAGLSIVAIVAWLVGFTRWKRGRSTWRPGTGELFDPLAVVGVIVLVGVAYAAINSPPATPMALRATAAALCAAFAVTFLVSAIGAVRTNWIPRRSRLAGSDVRE